MEPLFYRLAIRCLLLPDLFYMNDFAGYLLNKHLIKPFGESRHVQSDLIARLYQLLGRDYLPSRNVCHTHA